MELRRNERAGQTGEPLGDPGSMPGRVTSGCSYMCIVPDDAAGRWVFSGNTSFIRRFITSAPTQFNFYRFSISWARILPKGDVSVINQDGIDYYNNLINELLANNIQPVVTMFHWDLPQQLQDLGGLTNSIIVDYFEDYARILYTKFGDRVKWWITFNEPYSIVFGYSTECNAPGVTASGVGEYLAIHNLLKSHARAYHMYDNEFRTTQKGKVGITLSSTWAEPKSQSEADLEAAERNLQFTVSTHDFFGLNMYSSNLIGASNSSSAGSQISIFNDMGGMVMGQDPSWIQSTQQGFNYAPSGLRKMLKWVSDRYNHVDILITENGWPDKGEHNDTMRTRYFVNHLASVLDAANLDNVTVLGHTAWSLIDNFEWDNGFTVKFGLYHVDFNDPESPRAAKESAKIYTSIIKNRTLPENYLDPEN
ncbi:hypothetical protein PR048_023709 [Dryococelus australis]|uniref:Uncharacterized protein n=1 Tax=Dryococelus australis TaxID=614101 RepID=A0ABQ9GUY5_9NEOP|nr:hypothetical protein PR048_023709 [Dryococelus australis]